MSRPRAVTQQEWEVARAALLAREKEATRALDALAAERRRLPMVAVDDYALQGRAGAVRLLDVFEGRRQLVVYHFMFAAGEKSPCAGCSSFVDNVGNLAHLHARDTSFALISRAPYAQLADYRERMGWKVPWYSSQGSTLGRDLGTTTADGRETFKLSVLLSDGGEIFRTYETAARGVDRLRLDFNLLDLTPYGRQETWEDSPEGWRQSAPYTWWRRHDEYAEAGRA